MMLKNPVSINRPVDERIAWADSVFEKFANRFLENEIISNRLTELSRAAQMSRTKMHEVGIAALCQECDGEEGGSCCGKGLEDKYDGWLLLINRLLGVNLPSVRMHADGCFFLGEGGCSLRARHVICINYVCKKITEKTQPALLNQLREAEGKEINALFMLKEQMKVLVKQWMITRKKP